MSRHASIGLAIAILSLLGGCAPQERVAISELPANSFAAQWRAALALDGASAQELHLADDTLFVYTDDNQVFGLNRTSGRLTMGVRAAKRTDSLYAPVVLKDYFVFPTATTLQVYDKAGRFMQSKDLPFALRSSATGAGARVYLGADYSNGGRLVCVEIDPKGQPYPVGEKWGALTQGGLSAAPATTGGAVFAGSRDGHVYAVRADDRNAIWPRLRNTDYGFETGGAIVADLKADRDGVYVASMDTVLYCLSTDDGRMKWRYFATQPLLEESSPVVSPDTVYVYLPRTGLAAIDKADPAPIRQHRWIVADAVQFLAQDATHAYLRRKDNVIIAVSRAKGQVEFTSQRKDFVAFASNTKDAIIYASTAEGKVYAVRPVHKPGTVGELVLNAEPIGPALAMR